MAKSGWSDLSAPQQKAIMVAGALEIVVTTIALRDLAKSPTRRVRGPKPLWVLAMVVQPFGPLAYLALGRRPESTSRWTYYPST